MDAARAPGARRGVQVGVVGVLADPQQVRVQGIRALRTTRKVTLRADAAGGGA